MMWICCQLGAREHYAIPAALHQHKQLAALITDAWVPSQSPLNWLPAPIWSRLRDRTHPVLTSAPIHAWTAASLTFEVQQTIQNNTGWHRTIRRNQWFQQQAIKTLSLQAALTRLPTPPVLFAYSYAARDIFRYAKRQGWTTVLGQIDPGWQEERIIHQEFVNHANTYASLGASYDSAPPGYWHDWQEECCLADHIVVNSNWSAQALQQVGVASAKIQVIPLAYTPPLDAAAFRRTYPARFSGDRPLRVLFLGQFVVRKGIAALLQAAERLVNQPIEFWIVGSQQIQDAKLAALPNLRWFGSVPRHAVDPFYQTADVFLFPTLSDGFGLTQLEAQAWRLPIITSRYCGEVVKDQVNGVILQTVTAAAIATALQNCIDYPAVLSRFSEHSVDLSGFSLLRFQERLGGMVGEGVRE